jgi:hypothetical protein
VLAYPEHDYSGTYWSAVFSFRGSNGDKLSFFGRNSRDGALVVTSGQSNLFRRYLVTVYHPIDKLVLGRS